MEFSQNSNIEKPETWNSYEAKINLFQNRLDYCAHMSWCSLICENCNEVVKHNAAKLSCLSSYCKNPECIENRIRLVKAYLASLKLYSRNLLHIVFGFEHMERFTKSTRIKHQKVFKMLQKEMLKRGTALHMVAIRDIKKCKDGLYIHYHTANLPIKDYRKFMFNLFAARDKIIKQVGIKFAIKSKQYRNIKAIFNYFANRTAGLFGNIKTNNKYGYADLMNVRTFYDDFYKARKVQLYGLKPRAKLSVLALVLNNNIRKCPFCASEDLKLIRNELLEEREAENPKPPDILVICKQHDNIKIKENLAFAPSINSFYEI